MAQPGRTGFSSPSGITRPAPRFAADVVAPVSTVSCPVDSFPLNVSHLNTVTTLSLLLFLPEYVSNLDASFAPPPPLPNVSKWCERSGGELVAASRLSRRPIVPSRSLMMLSVLNRRTLSEEPKDELLLAVAFPSRLPNPNPTRNLWPGLARRLADADTDRRPPPTGCPSGSSACEVLSDVADRDASTSTTRIKHTEHGDMDIPRVAYLRISWIISKNWALLLRLRLCSSSFWVKGKSARYLPLSDRVHQLLGRMMRRHQLDAVDETVQLLAEEHNIAALPDRVLRLVAQYWQRVLVEHVLDDQYQHAEHHADAEQQKHAGYGRNTERFRLRHLAVQPEARQVAVPLRESLIVLLDVRFRCGSDG
uniref:Uncharacterized protein n=1 Tax=Anopheles atroparvus TaxID=41427 RepID=A0A182J4Z5_ANOAO